MKFLNSKEQMRCGVVIPHHSKTIPNSALTPKEILENYSRPSFDELAQLGFYDEEANFDRLTPDDFEDLTDIMDFSANSRRMNEIYLNAVKRSKKPIQNEEKPVQNPAEESAKTPEVEN